ncbi:antitermination protein, partial [Escherichia coli]|nr:antitermination protein [Escherichia coli]
MIIEKVMNNNCVQASMNGQEVIISGPGVGYNKKYGMSVPEHPANRIFYVRNEQKNKLYKLIEHVGNDSNLLIVFYVQIMPDDFVMQLHR